jgi:hypothetical protein
MARYLCARTVCPALPAGIFAASTQLKENLVISLFGYVIFLYMLVQILEM